MNLPKSEDQIKQIVSEYEKKHAKDEKEPLKNLVSFQCLLDAKLGYCRHHCLKILNLLRRAIKEKKGDPSQYRIFLFREKIKPHPRHAVIVLMMNNRRYVLDGANQFAADVTIIDESLRHKIGDHYVKFPMLEFITKLNANYPLEPQMRRCPATGLVR